MGHHPISPLLCSPRTIQKVTCPHRLHILTFHSFSSPLPCDFYNLPIARYCGELTVFILEPFCCFWNHCILPPWGRGVVSNHLMSMAMHFSAPPYTSLTNIPSLSPLWTSLSNSLSSAPYPLNIDVKGLTLTHSLTRCFSSSSLYSRTISSTLLVLTALTCFCLPNQYR